MRIDRGVRVTVRRIGPIGLTSAFDRLVTRDNERLILKGENELKERTFFTLTLAVLIVGSLASPYLLRFMFVSVRVNGMLCIEGGEIVIFTCGVNRPGQTNEQESPLLVPVQPTKVVVSTLTPSFGLSAHLPI